MSMLGKAARTLFHPIPGEERLNKQIRAIPQQPILKAALEMGNKVAETPGAEFAVPAMAWAPKGRMAASAVKGLKTRYPRIWKAVEELPYDVSVRETRTKGLMGRHFPRNIELSSRLRDPTRTLAHEGAHELFPKFSRSFNKMRRGLTHYEQQAIDDFLEMKGYDIRNMTAYDKLNEFLAFSGQEPHYFMAEKIPAWSTADDWFKQMGPGPPELVEVPRLNKLSQALHEILSKGGGATRGY